MIIYNYHPEYNFFTSFGVAQESPLEPGIFLIPGYSTTIEPPSCPTGLIQVFENNEWRIIEDKRGDYYHCDTKGLIKNENPYESPKNCTLDIPPEEPNGKVAIWDGCWKLVDDIRGTYYSIYDGREVIVTSLDQNIESLVKEKPPELQDGKFLRWNNGWKLIEEKYFLKPDDVTEEEWDRTEYQRLRLSEYPSLTELADSLYWNSKGDSSKLEAYFNSCEEVKNKYPKPES